MSAYLAGVQTERALVAREPVKQIFLVCNLMLAEAQVSLPDSDHDDQDLRLLESDPLCNYFRLQ